jgi:hypothetical protein
VSDIILLFSLSPSLSLFRHRESVQEASLSLSASQDNAKARLRRAESCATLGEIDDLNQALK